MKKLAGMLPLDALLIFAGAGVALYFLLRKTEQVSVALPGDKDFIGPINPDPATEMHNRLALLVGESNMIKLRIDYVKGEAYDQKSNVLMYYWNGDMWVKPVLTGGDAVIV
jgi:hypothetical protein